MPAIGLSGFARTGKTEAANYLQSVYGYERKHIANTLRAMLAVLLRSVGYGDDDITDILEGSRKDGWIIPEFNVTSRHLQITIGTEWGRDHINKDIWVTTWGYGIGPDDLVMNDSVRFPNEETIIQKLGGFTILLTRPGTMPAKFLSDGGKKAYLLYGDWDGVHPSERVDLLNPTYFVENEGSLEDLFAKLDRIMKERGVEPKHPQMTYAPETRSYTEDEVARIRDQMRMAHAATRASAAKIIDDLTMPKQRLIDAGIIADPRLSEKQ